MIIEIHITLYDKTRLGYLIFRYSGVIVFQSKNHFLTQKIFWIIAYQILASYGHLAPFKICTMAPKGKGIKDIGYCICSQDPLFKV